MHPIIFLPVFMALLIALSACHFGKIAIFENPDGTGFEMNLNKWNSTNHCKMSLSEGEEIQVEIEIEEGEVAFIINGQNGTNPYSGSKLKNFRFTLTVTQTDTYVFNVTGKNATGKIKVKKVA